MSALTYAATYGFETKFYGTVQLVQGNKVIAEQPLSIPQGKSFSDGQRKSIGYTSFNVEKGQSYDVKVNLNYILKNETGVMIHSGGGTTLSKTISVRGEPKNTIIQGERQ